MAKKRLVIIGIDGVPFRLMETFSEKSIMPNFNKMKKEGIFSKMAAPIPEISSISWSSIITGKNAGEHGIYGFTDLVPGTYTISFPNFSSLKAPAFWERGDGKKHVIINVPSTYPAREINGFLVSGFVSLDLERSVSSNAYLDKLKELDYRVDVDSAKAHKSMDLFLTDLFKTLDARIKCYRYFWDEIDWDVFMFVVTGSDRIGHFLWDAYEDETHKYRNEFEDFFKKVDEAIGEINSKLGENDSLIILSDHGMGLNEFNFNVNAFLKENDFLKTESDGKSVKIAEGSKAFAMDPGRIYINLEGKYPNGSVKLEEKPKIIKELIKNFKEIERDGKKIIKNIFRKEEIYHGKYLDSAPDIVLLGESGVSLRGSLSKNEIFDTDIFTGKHTQDDAFLYVKAKDINQISDNPSVEDVVGIIDKIMGE